jgi:UDP-N-acetylglucosamine enolpyruvyl transferase
MDRIRLRGGKPLEGSIGIGGAKNAALPLMAASLLSEETLTLSNVPHLADIATMAHLLQQHGVDVSMDGGNGTPEGRTIHLNAGKITSTLAPYDLVRKMRASVLVLGPLLARFGEAEVSLPGGCAIGTRPVDLHIMGLKAMGAEINVENGSIKAKAKKGLKGAVIRFPQVSVGATENLLMATETCGKRITAGLGRRHRKSADGGGARRRHHRAGECRAGTRDQRSRAVPRCHGRDDRRHGQRASHHPRQAELARRDAQDRAGPY